LDTYGRIYMYRFLPDYDIHARPIDAYPCKTKQAAAIMLMIHNNLDPKVAKHPHELITYGGNGAVFQNWAQYLLCMQYLSEMQENQTLVMYSGHPMGLFPSHKNAPRVVVTNGMMIPNHSTKDDWNKYNALGVTQYGQMTAGSFMYIGPQGIVHGTTITLLNAGRLKGLGDNLAGRIFITSGLGGMSGAQSIAAIITGAVGIIAEVDYDAIQQRIIDGYIKKENIFDNLEKLVAKTLESKKNKEAIALVYYGNIVDLWEYMVARNIEVELGSDQTSLHNIDDCGYLPCGYNFDEAKKLLLDNKPKFIKEVQSTLCRHVEAINIMVKRGTYFWDYGNAFLKEAGIANADIWENKAEEKYKYPSYVQDIMGPMCFDYGFGPFRWVCTSGDMIDLKTTDRIARDVLQKMYDTADDKAVKGQLSDNIRWIETAEQNLPIVGSLSRILYADCEGRMLIAKAFNDAIKTGEILAPIVLGRDHHDVSGTDSPYRETSNIYDGSHFTADMAIHNVIGDSFRGATWVSIHNGGGVGWGEVINGGFGMVIDGSRAAELRLLSMLNWDVNNGIARRSWARNPGAMVTIKAAMKKTKGLKVTVPHLVDDGLL
jgi:urocanate hydratase